MYGNMDCVLIFDTETTDLISNSLLPLEQQPRVIEFYGQKLDSKFRVVDELEFRCNPGIKLQPIITKITGIKNEDLIHEPPFKSKIDDVRKFIESATTVVAHNLQYDMSIVNMEFRRNKQPPPNWPKMKVCTVQQTEHIRGCRLKLADLHRELFGEDFVNAHTARADVEALARCWTKMKELEMV